MILRKLKILLKIKYMIISIYNIIIFITTKYLFVNLFTHHLKLYNREPE